MTDEIENVHLPKNSNMEVSVWPSENMKVVGQYHPCYCSYRHCHTIGINSYVFLLAKDRIGSSLSEGMGLIPLFFCLPRIRMT